MRRFKIYGNDTGQTYELNELPYFLQKIKNIGIKYKYGYLKIQNRQTQTSKEYQYDDIDGTLTIQGYENYETLRRFLVRNNSFRFYYSPVLSLERYILCDFTIITKTDINALGFLNCDFTITPKSLWLEDVVINTEITKDDSTGKIYKSTGLAGMWGYGYKYDNTGLLEQWTYGYTYNSEINGTAELINNGDVETPLQITLFGPTVNPAISLFDVNNNLLQQAQFTVSISEGEKLIIDSNAENMKIVLVNTSNQEIDRTSTQDYTKKTYLTLPVGSFRLTISDGNLTPVNGMVNYQTNYIGA